MMREGTIVDATLIAAPPSTKNKDGKRDPEMHQSKKGNDWHFGMKAHIGVDAASGLVHTVIGTAGNVSDVTQAGALLHQEPVPSPQDPLPRLGEEYRAIVHPVRVRQSGARRQALYDIRHPTTDAASESSPSFVI
jgi:IS5 family transposase